MNTRTKAWLNVIGLAFAFIGAGLVVWSAFQMTPERAAELGAARWGSDDPAVMLRQPMVREILAASRAQRWGFAFVATGFLLQIIANWPTANRLNTLCDTLSPSGALWTAGTAQGSV